MPEFDNLSSISALFQDSHGDHVIWLININVPKLKYDEVKNIS